MVLDTSAIVAVLLDEDDREEIIDLLAGAQDPVISAVTLVEASVVIQAKKGDKAVAQLDALLAAAGVRSVAVDLAQAHLAREAYARFGKGRSAAALNFGDCFSYALARATGRPLLFKGADFGRTDVRSAR